MIDKDRVALAVQALRSGQYRQGQGTLCRVNQDGTFSFCCLGVMTEVALENGLQGLSRGPGEPLEDRGYVTEGNEGGTDKALLPHVVREWYGFGTAVPQVHVGPDGAGYYIKDMGLTEVNDILQWDFRQIADAIEARYINGAA